MRQDGKTCLDSSTLPSIGQLWGMTLSCAGFAVIRVAPPFSTTGERDAVTSSGNASPSTDQGSRPPRRSAPLSRRHPDVRDLDHGHPAAGAQRPTSWPRESSAVRHVDTSSREHHGGPSRWRAGQLACPVSAARAGRPGAPGQWRAKRERSDPLTRGREPAKRGRGASAASLRE